MFVFGKLNKILNLVNKKNINITIELLMEMNFSELLYKFKKNIKPKKLSLKVDVLDISNNLNFENLIEFKKFKTPLVTIVIPVYNQWKYTYSCLYYLNKNISEKISYEVIIVDDVSTDETVNAKDYFKNITIIRNDVNSGFLLNCNNAVKKASGKYVLLLNNDIIIQENWLESLVELIESDINIGMTGSKLVYPDGRLQEAGGIIWQDATGSNYGKFDNPMSPEYNYVKECDYVSGASVLIHKSLWDEIGGFDERYIPAYFEDADLAFELRKRGYKVLYQPKSVAVHYEGISHGKNENDGIKSYQVINREKFLKKWENVLNEENFQNGINFFNARDRSRDKKTIVVIDYSVPQYDKDAGSRTMFQYLELFVKMGLNVKFAGDNFYQDEPYTSMLQRIGVEVLYGEWYHENFKSWLKSNSEQIDYIYLVRPQVAVKYIDFIKEHTMSKVLYNGVDFHYIRLLRNYEITKKKHLLNESEYMKKIEFDIFRKSDAILTISEYECEIIKKEIPGKNVFVIPTFFYNYEFPLGNNEVCFNSKEDLTFVGGFSHEPNIDGILWFVKNVFNYVLKEKSDIKLNIIGSNPTPEVLDLASENINVTGYLDDADLQKYYDRTRIVVAPLRYGAGVKGKVIEAIMHGIPVITTTIGKEGIKDAENFILFSDDSQKFADNIIKVYNDEIEWDRIRKEEIDYSNKYLSDVYAKKIMSKVLS